MKKILVLLVVILSLFLGSCGLISKDLNVEFSSLNQADLDSSFKYESSRKLTEDEVLEKGYDINYNEDYEVTYERVTASSSYDELLSFGMNNDIYYPGALVDFNTMNPIQIDRAPLTMSLNMEGAISSVSGQLSITVDEPKLSTIRNGISTLINRNLVDDSNLAANLSIEFSEINSSDEFNMKIGVGVQKSKFHISNNFELDKVNKQTNLLVTIKQVYYTVDVDLPNSQYGFFSEDVKNEDLENAISPEVIPTYVSSVSYGRIALISIQSNYSATEIENQLRAGWGKMSENPGSSPLKLTSVDFSNSIRSFASDSQTSISVFIYGGSTENAYQAALSSVENFSFGEEFFGDYDVRESAGLPISYKFRHLDGSFAKIQTSNEYDVKHVKYKPLRLYDWSNYDELLASRNINQLDELILDFSAMADFHDLKNSRTNASRTIVIPENIDRLVIRGPYDLTRDLMIQNLSIVIAHRNYANPINIILETISFSGNNSYPLLSDNFAMVNLEIVGDVEIIAPTGFDGINADQLTILGDGNLTVYGGSGITDNHGLHAVNTHYLEIVMAGKLKLVGGNGGVASNGVSYNRSVNPAGSEKNGRDGGDGHIGLNGGSAIITSDLIINSDFLQVELISGFGSNGGNGGDGEFGGSNNNSTSAGDGGNGGKGGNGGVIVVADAISINCRNITFTTGNGGTGGNGGSGGHSDISGIFGGYSGGRSGSKGYGGNMGSDGVLGFDVSSLGDVNYIFVEGKNGNEGLNGENGIKDSNLYV